MRLHIEAVSNRMMCFLLRIHPKEFDNCEIICNKWIHLHASASAVVPPSNESGDRCLDCCGSCTTIPVLWEYRSPYEHDARRARHTREKRSTVLKYDNSPSTAVDRSTGRLGTLLRVSAGGIHAGSITVSEVTVGILEVTWFSTKNDTCKREISTNYS
jgi:hypothetical protein